MNVEEREIYEVLKKRPEIMELIKTVRNLPESKQTEAIAFCLECFKK